MSARPNYSKSWRHSRATQRWHLAIHKCVARSLKRKFENAKVDPTLSADEKLHISWRFGFNLFYSNQFFEAINVLEFVCRKGKTEEEINQNNANKNKKTVSQIDQTTKGVNKGSLLAEKAAEATKEDEEEEEEEEESHLHVNYHVHLLAGRCCVQLFLQTSSHYHLESAYKHYQNCIECMTVPNEWEKKSLLRLPVVLTEMGHLLEHYGAFSSALELYTKVMTEYPHYRGYFDVMYRSSLVGRHISELMTKPEETDSMLNKVIDMLQFLLEALPATIDESHIILLYARTLDKARDPAIRFRANGVFKNLFDHLRDAKRCKADKFVQYKDWADSPSHWFSLGQELNQAGEPLLAKDCFEIYTQKVDSKRQAGKDLSAYIDVDSAMLIAKTHASYQNYGEATRFAEIALKQQRLNKEVRSSLTKWSKIHAVKLGKESAAVSAMHHRWKSRVWSNTYQSKLRAVVLYDLEEKIKKNRYDPVVREDLAYFGRDKWRSRFVFETACAIRLQRFIRGRIKIWRAQQRLRTKYLNRAVEAYRVWGRKPFDWALRNEILAITASKHCPRKHIINRVADTIIWQNSAVEIMHRAYGAHRNRKMIRRGISNTKLKQEEMLFRYATKIQCMTRCARAKKAVLLSRKQHLIENHAALIIQRFIRWRQRTFQHAVTIIVYRQKARHRHARLTFVHVLTYYIMRYTKRKRAEIAARQWEKERLARLEALHANSKRKHKAARVLQRCFAAIKAVRLVHLAKKSMTARRSAESSISSLAKQIFEVQRIVRTDGTVIELQPIATDPHAAYYPPGITQSSKQFLRALDQSSIFCSREFSAGDCMMLASVLRHGQCRVQKLIFHNIASPDDASFEFDILPAISKCRTLRSVYILGGSYSPGFLTGLVKDVQTENPYVKELVLENIVDRRACREVATTVGLLMLDYFNYSVPGIMVVSLHGCGLTDGDIDLITQSLRVNSSLKTLTLSRNALTDVGLIKLLQAVEQCRHSLLTCLDLRHNLIELKSVARSQLDATSATIGITMMGAQMGGSTPRLELFLCNNLVSRPYPTPAHARGSKVNGNAPGGNSIDYPLEVVNTRSGLAVISSDIKVATVLSRATSKKSAQKEGDLDPEEFGVSCGKAKGVRQAVMISMTGGAVRSGRPGMSPKKFLAALR